MGLNATRARARLQSVFGYRPFTIAEYRQLRGWLTDLALQANKASALAEQSIESLRSQRIVVPAITMIDRLERFF